MWRPFWILVCVPWLISGVVPQSSTGPVHAKDIPWLKKQAQQAFQSAQYGKAVFYYERLLKRYLPFLSNTFKKKIRFRLGKSYAKQSLYQKALQAWEPLLASIPYRQAFQLRTAYARSTLAMKNFEKTLLVIHDFFQKRIQKTLSSSQKATLLLLKGWALLGLQNFSKTKFIIQTLETKFQNINNVLKIEKISLQLFFKSQKCNFSKKLPRKETLLRSLFSEKTSCIKSLALLLLQSWSHKSFHWFLKNKRKWIQSYQRFIQTFKKLPKEHKLFLEKDLLQTQKELRSIFLSFQKKLSRSDKKILDDLTQSL